MKIGGFQKVSLIDYPGQISSIIFTQGCNFHCPYCHNPELVYPEQFQPPLSGSKILDFLLKRQDKINRVVITGGEPTIHSDIIPFISTLKSKGFFVKLDTNGSSSSIINTLIQEQLLDYIAMDIKGPLHVYNQLVQKNVTALMQNIQDSINLILTASPRIPYEFRTVFDKTLLTDDDIIRLKIQYPILHIKNVVSSHTSSS